MRSITIKDIAQKAGVSYAQVSRALNGEYGVSKATAELVHRVAQEIGYSPNELARSLVKQRTTTIAYLVNDISNPNTAEIALSVVSTAYKLGFQTFIGNSFWDSKVQKAQLNSMIQNRVAGIIIGPATNDFLDMQLNIPVVSINSLVSERFSSVVVDSVYGEFCATEHLIKGGYKKIAFVGGIKTSLSMQDRLKGYLEALEQYHIPVDGSLIHYGEFSMENGYETMAKLMTRLDPPDAVVCGNDMIAIGVLRYAEENGIAVPDRLGIVGFDDIGIAALPQINLTTVSQDSSEKIGDFAARLLISAIESADKDIIEHKVLKTKLIQRGTTRLVDE